MLYAQQKGCIDEGIGGCVGIRGADCQDDLTCGNCTHTILGVGGNGAHDFGCCDDTTTFKGCLWTGLLSDRCVYNPNDDDNYVTCSNCKGYPGTVGCAPDCSGSHNSEMNICSF
jgi:hypothetical protein